MVPVVVTAPIPIAATQNYRRAVITGIIIRIIVIVVISDRSGGGIIAASVVVGVRIIGAGTERHRHGEGCGGGKKFAKFHDSG
jgi:hypothetical protein